MLLYNYAGIFRSRVVACSGDQYRIGCGLGDGNAGVLNITRFNVQMNFDEEDAKICFTGLCDFDIIGPYR